VLYGVVKEHWRELYAHAREHYEAPLPRYVEDEFREYLRCGDFARGFVHTKCTTCRHDLLVAFSCKRRALCPSCSGRRMAGAAAHLVDRVLPAVPVRQYVLAFPYELSGLAATKPDVLTALSRIFWDAVRLRYQGWAKDVGLPAAEAGAVTGVQRFGSSLNLHVHLHLVALDGVYVEEDDALRFVPADSPRRSELEAMAKRIHARVTKWLVRRGYLREDGDSSNAVPESSPTEALAVAGMQRGTMVTVRDSDDTPDGFAPPAPLARETDAVTFERFNLHASVHIHGGDDLGRERLCRYLTRPAFSLSRLRILRDGNVSYRVKKVSRHRATHRVMSPLEFLARLAALVPPPRYPLLRFHGLVAPRHAWRKRVVPRPPPHARGSDNGTRAPPPSHARPCTEPPPRREAFGIEREPRTEKRGDGAAAFVVATAIATSSWTQDGVAELVGPSVLSVAHWHRLLGGELYAASSRVDWAILLKRTFEVDVKLCVRCGGRLCVRAVITEPTTVTKILTALSRARDPPQVA
jgi:hypothetical protein